MNRTVQVCIHLEERIVVLQLFFQYICDEICAVRGLSRPQCLICYQCLTE